MRAFDSIKMGQKCKTWSSQSEESSNRCRLLTRGTSIGGEQWIVNATTDDRMSEVVEKSGAVLDGGPRWVVSTALGFLTGGSFSTAVYVVLFALGNYTIYVKTRSTGSSLRIDDVAFEILVYMILAVGVAVASAPGVSLITGVSGWVGFASGLVVELLLTLCVLLSVVNVYNFIGPSLELYPTLLLCADPSVWAAPAFVWVSAYSLRNTAFQAAKNTLANLWRFHPRGPNADVMSQTFLDRLWNSWAYNVQKCAERVGSYSMLGFSKSDLAILTESGPTQNALEVIKKLGSSLGKEGSESETWVQQSLTFMNGYDSRVRDATPYNDKPPIALGEIAKVVRTLIQDDGHEDVVANMTKPDTRDPQSLKYLEDNQKKNRWYYAGRLMADSDIRGKGPKSEAVGRYGPRFAVSLGLLVEGTDPLARLSCFADSKVRGSNRMLLSQALSLSAKALVSELASSAGVEGASDALGDGPRGLAYAAGDVPSLAYAPDEMIAASHLHETIVISDDTFCGDDGSIFEELWGGSERVEKRVDVSDLVPLAASLSEAGYSARKGWICLLAYTLTILVAHLSGQSKLASGVLALHYVPYKNKMLLGHMNSHFYMIYVSYVLNYFRFFSRWLLLAPRGQAAEAKAQKIGYVVFVFVNVLPVLACNIFSGRDWWFACIPCFLANLPGLLNTIVHGWASAFKYEWWSWHVPLKWFSGWRYLEVVGLRKRIGRNILYVNKNGQQKVVKNVRPERGSLSPSPKRFLVVG